MAATCVYNELSDEEPTINDCSKCEEKYNFPHEFCCLQYCGEHDFCRNCNHGIYEKVEEKKDEKD